MSKISTGSTALAAAVFLSLSSFTAPGVAGDREDDFSLVTQNQYLGTPVRPLLDALVDGSDVDDALKTAIARIQASATEERLFKQAETIIERMPHVVALQEVVELSCQPIPGIPGLDQATVQAAFVVESTCPDSLSSPLDHLQLTEFFLVQVGYRRAAIVENSRVSLPFDADDDFVPDAVITLLDRDVLLTRSDIDSEVVDFNCVPASADGCNFKSGYVELPSSAGGGRFARGYVAIDFELDGKRWRVVNTHLEVPGLPTPERPFQVAQASELVEAVAPRADSDGPDMIIVTGDFNSSPESEFLFALGDARLDVSPYAQLVDAGFEDLWPLRPGRSPGHTCCQQFDLANEESLLDRRIDLVFAAGNIDRVKANVLNNSPLDKTLPSLLWPSDHAGVYIELRRQPRRGGNKRIR